MQAGARCSKNEEVKSFGPQIYSRKKTADFGDLVAISLANQPPITHRRQVRERFLILNLHIRKMTNAYFDIPLLRGYSNDSKKLFDGRNNQILFLYFCIWHFPRNSVKRVLLAPENAHLGLLNLSDMLEHYILENNSDEEIERASRRHHQHIKFFFNNDSMTTVSESPTRRRLKKVQLVKGEKQKKNDNTKTPYCVLCHKPNHHHSVCRNKPSHAGKNNTCYICGGSNHRAALRKKDC